MKVFQIREGAKGIFEVLKWYNDINAFILDYISVSIKDSDVSDFYRYIIGFKNLLRSVEFSGKSGIYGLRYLTQDGYLEREYMHEFIRFEMLRREYLNQTFNFMPAIKEEYLMMTENIFFFEFINIFKGSYFFSHENYLGFFRHGTKQKNISEFSIVSWICCSHF